MSDEKGASPAPSAQLPVGTIVMWGGSANPPTGWLICDGRKFPQSGYPLLYAAIKDAFGPPTGRGSDFYIPDLRGRFIRGVDMGAGRDPDAAKRTNMVDSSIQSSEVGSVQSDQLRKHTHGYQKFPGKESSTPIASGRYWVDKEEQTSPSGGSETRPLNAYLYFIIKAE